MDEQITLFRKKLKNKLNPLRYEHSLSVSFTCMALAMRYECDLKKAELAGLLHDCAKRYRDEELILRCEKQGITLTESELLAPAVIHAKYGAWMAENKYGITDEEILSAIRWHTTGRPNMSLLDKILYVADYIEPRRDRAPDLDRMRSLAFENLDAAIYEMLNASLVYLQKQGGTIDSMTQETLDYYHELLDEQTPMGIFERRISRGQVKRDGKIGGSSFGRKKRRGHSNH